VQVFIGESFDGSKVSVLMTSEVMVPDSLQKQVFGRYRSKRMIPMGESNRASLIGYQSLEFEKRNKQMKTYFLCIFFNDKSLIVFRNANFREVHVPNNLEFMMGSV
jgi:hypothetical protein